MRPSRHPRTAAAILIAAGLTAAAAPATSIAAPSPVAGKGLIEDLLAPGLSPAAVPALVAQLTPEQITGLLGDPSTLTTVLDGLAQTTTELLAGQPSPAQVDQLVAQVTALLQGGLPTDPAQVADLQTVLDGLAPMLQLPGLDPSGLSALQGVVTGLLGGGATVPGAPGGGTTLPGTPGTPTGAGSLAASLASLFGPMKPGTTTAPGTGSTAGGAGAGAGAGTAARTMRHRARATKVRVRRGGRVARVTLRCPAAAPSCIAVVRVSAAGRTGKWRFFGLRAGETRTVRMALPSGAAKRLGTRGGKVKVTVATVGSSLPRVSKSTRVKRARVS